MVNWLSPLFKKKILEGIKLPTGIINQVVNQLLVTCQKKKMEKAIPLIKAIVLSSPGARVPRSRCHLSGFQEGRYCVTRRSWSCCQ